MNIRAIYDKTYIVKIDETKPAKLSDFSKNDVKFLINIKTKQLIRLVFDKNGLSNYDAKIFNGKNNWFEILKSDKPLTKNGIFGKSKSFSITFDDSNCAVPQLFDIENISYPEPWNFNKYVSEFVFDINILDGFTFDDVMKYFEPIMSKTKNIRESTIMNHLKYWVDSGYLLYFKKYKVYCRVYPDDAFNKYKDKTEFDKLESKFSKYQKTKQNKKQKHKIMSYTPEDQLLEPSLEKILEGIEEFNNAFTKRLEANDGSNGPKEWSDEHIDELAEISAKFQTFKVKLTKLKRETR